MSNEVKAKIYREMIREINARGAPLRAELKQLESAEQRILEIKDTLAVLDAEREEYVDALAPLEAPSAEAVPPSSTPNTPKFDR
jgi:hypothetical protein